MDLLAGGQGVFGIALGRIWQEVDGTLAELPGGAGRDGRRGGSRPSAQRRARSPASELARRSRPANRLTPPVY